MPVYCPRRCSGDERACRRGSLCRRPLAGGSPPARGAAARRSRRSRAQGHRPPACGRGGRAARALAQGPLESAFGSTGGAPRSTSRGCREQGTAPRAGDPLRPPPRLLRLTTYQNRRSGPALSVGPGACPKTKMFCSVATYCACRPLAIARDQVACSSEPDRRDVEQHERAVVAPAGEIKTGNMIREHRPRIVRFDGLSSAGALCQVNTPDRLFIVRARAKQLLACGLSFASYVEGGFNLNGWAMTIRSGRPAYWTSIGHRGRVDR